LEGHALSWPHMTAKRPRESASLQKPWSKC